MKRRIILLTACVAALLAGEAAADSANTACCRGTPPSWYFGISGQAVFLQPVDYTHTAAFPNPDRENFSTGYGIGGSVGYRIYPNIRGELEATLRSSDVSSDTATLQVGSGAATQKSTALMANLYYDLHNSSSFTPYIGAGIGEVEVKTNRFYTVTNNLTQVTTDSKNLQNWTMGYQFMAGVNYEIMSGFTPFELSLGYRYFTDKNSNITLANMPGTFSFSNVSHNIELGGKIFF